MVFTRQNQIKTLNLNQRLQRRRALTSTMMSQNAHGLVERRLCMTHNQIEYWNLIEAQRANRARELENTRSNRQREIENTRSNMQQEELRRIELADKRNQFTRELAERNRSNVANELERRRSATAEEMLRAQSNMISTLSQHEQSRANLAKESLTAQSNLIAANKASNESRRISNDYSIGLRAQNISKIGTLGELSNKRVSNEIMRERNALQRSTIAATNRRNMLDYELGVSRINLENQRLQEQVRHNQVSEYLNAGTTALMSGLRLGLGGRR